MPKNEFSPYATISQSPPACPSCGRACEPGATWKGANYCRGLILLRFIEDKPGLSAWELSQISSVPYTDATRGLAKLRDYQAVDTVMEERSGGDGFRYRYWPTDNPDAHQRFLEALRRVEGL
jgi:hypothetical protein